MRLENENRLLRNTLEIRLTATVLLTDVSNVHFNMH